MDDLLFAFVSLLVLVAIPWVVDEFFPDEDA